MWHKQFQQKLAMREHAPLAISNNGKIDGSHSKTTEA
jgi:hypothetical protein